MVTRKPLEELTIVDDYMFTNVMCQKEIAKQFLEELFGRKINKIEAVIPQSTVKKEYASHGVRFDIEFVGDNVVYDIEMQQCGSASPAGQLELLCRSRYYHSNIDVRYLSESQSYRKMRPAVVIFICCFDPFGSGLAKYTQSQYIEEMNKPVFDGHATIYLNAKYSQQNAPESIIAFLEYVAHPEQYVCEDGSFVSRVYRAVEDAKVNPNIRRSLMSYYDTMRQERIEGREEGLREGYDLAIRALAKSLNTSYEELKKLLEKSQSATKPTSGIQQMNL